MAERAVNTGLNANPWGLRRPVPPAVTQMLISDVTAQPTLVKLMGRTFSAINAGQEVIITDTTDITRPLRLGCAKAQNGEGAWQIVSARDHHLLTTPDLLCAVAALRASTDPAFTAG